MQHLETCLLPAEADRVFLSSNDVFLTALFHWIYKMKYCCYQYYFVIHGWFVIGFLVEKCTACQSHRNLISDGIVFKNELTLLPLTGRAVRGLKSLK